LAGAPDTVFSIAYRNCVVAATNPLVVRHILPAAGVAGQRLPPIHPVPEVQ
jgi:hypothetical protein